MSNKLSLTPAAEQNFMTLAMQAPLVLAGPVHPGPAPVSFDTDKPIGGPVLKP